MNQPIKIQNMFKKLLRERIRKHYHKTLGSIHINSLPGNYRVASLLKIKETRIVCLFIFNFCLSCVGFELICITICIFTSACKMSLKLLKKP